MLEHEKLMSELEEWIGSRWMHGQAVKGYATDCVQFLVHVGKKMDWVPPEYEPPKYNRDWALHNNESVLEQEIGRFCNRLQMTEEQLRRLEGIEVGDILLFREGMCASHAGLLVEDGVMIHAHIRKGVVKEPISQYFLERLKSVWRPYKWRM